ncbi:hypothetical protein EYA84_02000 [Verrucosispora sp. SN26_14.1]|uniref:hypothetical protein n=1 Tax=Verrucosispora sp. SN26_14.1 TaxID=2527879 RepID=UPI0010335CA5|nr:hypothetical protein [Verrucosispora sp. SN26_14.1]TBL44238.1 hypothetical protein EYA84_02000 [Verrucosispora sp. SN26_14.1]
MTSIKDRIKKASHNTKRIPVYLGLDHNLLDEYQQALSDLEDAESRAPDADTSTYGDSLESVPTSQAVVEQRERVQQLRDRLDEYKVMLTIRPLDDDEWERVRLAHPPRRGGDGVEADLRDTDSQFNTSTFPGGLLRAAVVDPQLDDEDWGRLLGTDGQPALLPMPQQHQAADEVLRISRHRLNIPFS